MAYPRSVLRQYWAGERPRLWRISRWMLGVALILTPFAFFLQTPRNVIALLIVAMIVVVVGRRLQAGRDMHTVLLRRWQKDTSFHVQAAWPALAHTLRLQIRTLDGRTIFAGLGTPRWEGMTLVASVSLPRGLVREELVSASDRIAQAFSALRASVHGQQISALQLHLEFVDALGQTFTAPLGGSWDGGSVTMGISPKAEVSGVCVWGRTLWLLGRRAAARHRLSGVFSWASSGRSTMARFRYGGSTERAHGARHGACAADSIC